jgi:hypothetical protein
MIEPEANNTTSIDCPQATCYALRLYTYDHYRGEAHWTIETITFLPVGAIPERTADALLELANVASHQSLPRNEAGQQKGETNV